MASNQAPITDIKRFRMLAVSFAYPPLAYPRSIQVARLIKYLRLKTVLVCADERDSRRDFTLEPDAEAHLEACLRVPFYVSRARQLANSLAHRVYRPLWNRWNRTPDQYRSWVRAALATIERYSRANSYSPDLIVTFSQPTSDHLIGLELKRRHHVPWIAHFSDPWTENPFHEADVKTKAHNLALEREVMAQADRLIFTSNETVDLVMSKYPTPWRKKTRVFPQCFDPSVYPPRDTPNANKINVRYVGNFYGTRSPAPLVRVLAAIHASDPHALEDTCFELIGPTNPNIVKESGGSELPAWLFSASPSVEYSESLRLMTSADGLLIIDAPAEVSVFLPSKLIDYIGAGRPVLGLTPQGAAASLIKQLGGWVANPADVEEGAAAMKAFLTYLRTSRSSSEPAIWGEPRVRELYEARSLARRFEEFAFELLG